MALHPEVPGRFDVALDGRPYMVDVGQETPDFRRQSIPLLRNQADTGLTFGESSLNPEELSVAVRTRGTTARARRFLTVTAPTPAGSGRARESTCGSGGS